MEQQKIGKFIAECRKEKGLTQVQLVEQLGITNRAVSKWENAKSMPDVSVMTSLCEILDISVNELLSGEKIKMEDYKAKAEANLTELQRKQETVRKAKKWRNIVLVVVIILASVSHLAINYYYPNNKNTGMGLVIALAYLILYGSLLFKYYEMKLK